MTDEQLKKEILETVQEMGLDTEWYKNEILEDEYCMSIVRSYFNNE